MQPVQAAAVLHDWAIAEGVLIDGPAREVTASAADLALVQPVSDAAKAILRSKQLQSIGFNSATNEVIAFLRRAVPASKKVKAVLPSMVDDVPIKYRQGAQNVIVPGPTMPAAGPSYVVRVAAGLHRYTCGSSISVGNHRDAGTLGCLVRDAAGVLHGLSNNHVAASCSYAGVGLPILAPGVFDVVPNGLPPFTIGFHARALPMAAGSADNIDPSANMDAAIFRIADEALVSSHQGGAYDTPANSAPLAAGLAVQKVGRTTGHTSGTVISQFIGAHPIRYNADLYGFSGSVYFEPMFAIVGVGTAFASAGDSGSLIVSVDANGQRSAVGIVVGTMSDGAAPGGELTVAAPIEPILAALGLSLVGGHNV
jgi:hypothetical protein